MSAGYILHAFTSTLFHRPHAARRLRAARQLRMPSAEQQGRFAAVDLAALEQEVRAVEAACVASGSPLVCSHNDLLAGNVMVPIQVRSSAVPVMSG